MGCTVLPSWSVHRRVYGFLGLNVGVCRVVDRILDVDPPLVREVIPVYMVGDLEDLRGFVGHDFGCGDAVFPLMCRSMFSRFGLSGVRCFVAHCVLDFVEKLCLSGYDRELIVSKVNAKLERWLENCKYVLGCQCPGVEDTKLVCDMIIKNISEILSIIKGSLYFNSKKERIILRRIVLGFMKYIVTPCLKYVIRDSKKRSAVRSGIVKEFTDWLKKNKEYLDLNEIIEGLNELEKTLVEGNIRTIPQLRNTIKGIAEKNEQFKLVRAALLKILNSKLRN